MQEKRVHIDDKFSEHAWADMRAMLDRELPVAEGRRRGFAWWWALAAGLVVLLGAAMWFMGRTENNNRSKSYQPIAIENNSNDNDSPDNLSNSSLTINDKSNAGENVNREHAIKEIESKSSGANGKSVLRFKHLSQNPQGKSKNHYYSNPIDYELPTIATEPRNQNASDIKEEDVVPIAAKLEIKEEFTPEKISEINLKTLENQSIGTIKVASTFPKVHKWSWSLQGSGLFVSNLIGIGAEAGIIGERVLTNRFSIGTGLNYDYLQQPIYAGVSNVSITAESNGKVFYDNAGLNANDIFDPNLSDVKSRKLTLHYLNLPVSMICHIGKRWDANLGGSFGLLLSSSSVYVRDGLLYKVGFDSERADSNTTLAKVSLIDFAITGGIGFHINRTWGLQLNYVHGVKDILPDNSAGDYNRLIKFGFQYKLSSGR